MKTTMLPIECLDDPRSVARLANKVNVKERGREDAAMVINNSALQEQKSVWDIVNPPTSSLFGRWSSHSRDEGSQGRSRKQFRSFIIPAIYIPIKKPEGGEGLESSLGGGQSEKLSSTLDDSTLTFDESLADEQSLVCGNTTILSSQSSHSIPRTPSNLKLFEEESTSPDPLTVFDPKRTYRRYAEYEGKIIKAPVFGLRTVVPPLERKNCNLPDILKKVEEVPVIRKVVHASARRATLMQGNPDPQGKTKGKDEAKRVEKKTSCGKSKGKGKGRMKLAASQKKLAVTQKKLIVPRKKKELPVKEIMPVVGKKKREEQKKTVTKSIPVPGNQASSRALRSAGKINVGQEGAPNRRWW